MKLFLVLVFSLLAFALAAVVLVYWFVSMQINSETASQTQAPATVTVNQTGTTTLNTKSEEPVIPEDGVPLRDLPLSATQEKVITTAGIDIETFEFTPAMLECGVAKLGADRIAEIIAGETPSLIEIARLTPCIS